MSNDDDDDAVEEVSVADRERSARRATWISTLLVALLFAVIPLVVLIVGLSLHRSASHTPNITTPADTDNSAASARANNSASSSMDPTPEFKSIDLQLQRATADLVISSAQQSITHLEAARRDWQHILDQTFHDDTGSRIAADEQLLLQFIALQAMPQPEHDSPELHAVLNDIRVAATADSAPFDQLTGATGELAQIAFTAFVFHEAHRGVLEKLRTKAANSATGEVDLATKLLNRSTELASQRQFASSDAANAVKAQLEAEQTELSEQLEENRSTMAELTRQLERLQRGQPIDDPSSQSKEDSSVASRDDYLRESDKIRTMLKPFITPGYVQPESADKLAYQNIKQPVSFSALKQIGALQPTQRGIEILFRVGGSKSSTYQNDRPLGGFPRMNSRDELEKPDVLSKVRDVQRLLREYGPYLVEDELLSP